MRFLGRELAEAGATALAQGETWILSPAIEKKEFCFATHTLIDPVELKGGAVNATAKAILDYFLESCREEKFTDPWALQFRADDMQEGLTKRATAVERTFKEALAKRLARVARLARPQPANMVGQTRGLFVFWRDFENFWIARDAILGGQRRMSDDPGAPSRSYLKLEEAFGVLGCEPQRSESVVDLGAAPGGWSYCAAKRGASVLALDNGPLKGAALGHPLIEHECSDAFRFMPAPGKRYDWLLCDVVDDPDKVLALLERWVGQRACRRFVVNLKFGRTDPLPLLHRSTGPQSVLARACVLLRARHLFHDREELTLVGELRA